MHKTYVHVQTPGGRSLGFSVMLVQGNTGYVNIEENGRARQKVLFSLTFCNAKDKHFDKKIARAMLHEKEQRLVDVRELPRLLAEAEADAQGINPDYWLSWVSGTTTRYNYILRRFV